MRLGGPVFRWKTAEEWAQRHLEKGYGAAYWPLGLDADAQTEQVFVETAARHGLVIAEVGVWNHLQDPDPVKAAENRRVCIARMRQADRVGARCCVNVSGSCSAIWDGPHRDNLTKETFDQIVDMTRRMIDEARLTKTVYTLEPMPWMYPIDAESALALIEAVDRSHFGAHADMVNIINSPEKIYRTGELTRHFFAVLGDKIRSVHVKDIAISSRLTVHMDEVLAGTGEFDHRTLLQECAKLTDVPVMLEHLQTEAEYDQASQYLQRLANELGLTFDKGF